MKAHHRRKMLRKKKLAKHNAKKRVSATARRANPTIVNAPKKFL